MYIIYYYLLYWLFVICPKEISERSELLFTQKTLVGLNDLKDNHSQNIIHELKAHLVSDMFNALQLQETAEHAGSQ